MRKPDPFDRVLAQSLHAAVREGKRIGIVVDSAGDARRAMRHFAHCVHEYDVPGVTFDRRVGDEGMSIAHGGCIQIIYSRHGSVGFRGMSLHVLYAPRVWVTEFRSIEATPMFAATGGGIDTY